MKIPTSPPPRGDPKMAQEGQVATWLEEAQEMVDRYKLAEAEDLFWKVLEGTNEEMKQMDKLIVTSLTGLSEVYQKRARSMRNNEMEWHRMYLYAITSQRRAHDHCVMSLQWPRDNQVESWLQDQKHKSSAHYKSLEECLVRSLQDRIVLTDKAQPNKSGLNAMWVSDLQSYCKKKITKRLERYGSKENLFLLCQEEEEMEKMDTQEPEEPEEQKPQEPPAKKKKINFNKVQETIQNLVKQISQDMRQKEFHMRLQRESKYPSPFASSPLYQRERFGRFSSMENLARFGSMEDLGTLARYSSTENLYLARYQKPSHVLNRPSTLTGAPHRLMTHTERVMSSISPLSENNPLLFQLERVLNNDGMEEDYGGLSPKESANSCDKYDELSPMSEASDITTIDEYGEYEEETKLSRDSSSPEKSEKGMENHLSSKKKWDENVKVVSQRHSAVGTANRFTLDRPLNRTTRSSSVYVRENQHREHEIIKGVLTVWKGYKKPKSVDEFSERTAGQKSFEEVSPLTEVLEMKLGLPTSISDPTEDEQLLDKLPITEKTLKLSMVHALNRLADKQKKNKKYGAASDLYKYSLGVLKTLLKEDALVQPLTHILQNLGAIKCQYGDIEGGVDLLERCIQIYQDSNEKDSDFHTARLWLEMGNFYMEEQWKESSLYEHIMKTVRQEIEYEVRREVVGDMADEDSDDEDDDSEGQSYWISTQEAISCYNMALSILRKLQLSSGDRHADLLVTVLTKLGDCSIMAGDYDQAVGYFEEVLRLFKNMLGSTALPTNAHVLSMLGTANYLQRNFPKAVAMYECAHILQQHLYGSEDATAETVFTMTMLGITFYTMKHYHKCIACCLKAYELYSYLFKEEMASMDALHKWFVTETLYSIGFSYSTLNFHEKSLHYLNIAYKMLKADENFDTKQLVRILKAIADVYTSMEENEKALEFYDEALQCSTSLGDEKSATALQNKLLNRMAGLHVNAKQYDTAASYLEQALDCQKSVQNSIKDDLVGILKQLGITYALSGDVERAIECFNDCIEAFQEMSGDQSRDMSEIYGTLGTLYHVKACIQDDNDTMLELMDTAESNYKQAVEMDPRGCACLQYSNYLYQQEQYGDALMTMLPFLHLYIKQELPVLVYNGVEQAVLPEYIQPDVDDTDEVVFNSKVYANFLGVLCYKQLHLSQDADDCLICLYKLCCKYPNPLNFSMLGYALLELMMYEEAAMSFYEAVCMDPGNDLPMTNMCMSLLLEAFNIITRGAENIVEYFYQQKKTRRRSVRPSRSNLQTGGHASIRDSGYYDHGIGIEGKDTQQSQEEVSVEDEEEYQVWESSETVETPVALLHALEIQRRESSVDGDDLTDRGYNSSERLEQQGLDDEYETSEVWESEEEVVQTPPAILAALRQQYDHQEYHDESTNYIENLSDEEDGSRTPTATLDYQDVGRSRTGYDTPVNDHQEEQYSVVEETVETPAFLLEALRKQSASKYEDSNRHPNVQVTKKYGDGISADEDWTIVQSSEVVVNPRTSSQAQTREKQNVRYVTETIETPTLQFEVVRNNKRLGSRENVVEEPSPEEEVWHTEETVVETPSFLLQALKDKHEMDTSAEEVEEKWQTEETVEDTPQAILDMIARQVGGQDEAKTRTSDEHVWYHEEVVDTPSAILSSVNNIQLSSSGSSTNLTTTSGPIVNVEPSSPEQTDEWVTEEEVVETPSAILKALAEARSMMNDIQVMSNTLNKLDEAEAEVTRAKSPNYQYEARSLAKSPTYEYESIVRAKSPTYQYEMANRAKSPSYLYDALHDDTPTPTEETETEWVTTEETVETPLSLLKALADQIDQDLEVIAKKKDDTLDNSDRWSSDTESHSSYLETLNKPSYSYPYQSDHQGNMTKEKSNTQETGYTWKSNDDALSKSRAILESYRNNNGWTSKESKPKDEQKDSKSTTRSWEPYLRSSGYDSSAFKSSSTTTDSGVTNRYETKSHTNVEHDISNGNTWSSRTSYHNPYSSSSKTSYESSIGIQNVQTQQQQQKTPEEEQWQTWETVETVDTPPEILALLKSGSR